MIYNGVFDTSMKVELEKEFENAKSVAAGLYCDVAVFEKTEMTQ